MTTTDFVKTYYKDAMLSQLKTGISLVFTLAQAALESGWGSHAPKFNFFGIKYTGTGEKQLLSTREVLKTSSAKFPIIKSITQLTKKTWEYHVEDWFRAYNSASESFIGHGNFFLQNSNYKQALTVKNDPNAFANEISKAGYATDPNYAVALTKIITMVENEIKNIK
jgi:flagellar protein FlgJ